LTTIIAVVLAASRAVPIIDTWIQLLITAYVNYAVDRMSYENWTALKKAVNDKDQRDLEKAIGNPNAGEPSGVGDIRTSLPGVSH
jgi:divalent metal cation (Fe/Co/Zn/Cd) transporter